MPDFQKKKPIHLSLAEYRIVEKLINEYEEEDITPEERRLRTKVRRIIWCIERAREYKAKTQIVTQEEGAE